MSESSQYAKYIEYNFGKFRLVCTQCKILALLAPKTFAKSLRLN